MKCMYVVRCCLGLALVALPWSAFGQGVPVLKQGNIELGAFGAATFGGGVGKVVVADNQGKPVSVLTPTSNGAAGIHVGFALNSHIVLYTEFAYLAGGRLEVNQDKYVRNDANPVEQRAYTDARLSSLDVNGGLEYRWQTKRVPKLVPYVSGGVGGIRTSVSLQQGSLGLAAPGTTFSTSLKTTTTAGNGGAGVRYFFTEHAGLRVEMKGFKGGNDIAFGRVAFGLFYQFR